MALKSPIISLILSDSFFKASDDICVPFPSSDGTPELEPVPANSRAASKPVKPVKYHFGYSSSRGMHDLPSVLLWSIRRVLDMVGFKLGSGQSSERNNYRF